MRASSNGDKGKMVREWVMIMIAILGLAGSGVAGYTTIQTRFAVQQVQIETNKADIAKLEAKVTANALAANLRLDDVTHGITLVSNSLSRMEGQLSVISGRMK